MKSSLTHALSSGLSAVATFIPKLLIFLIILIVGLIVAKAIAKAVSALLEKAGFDRAVERGGIKHALAKSKFDASDIVAKIIYYALVLFVLQLAFGVFGPNPISDLLTKVITFVPSLIVAIIIIVVASAIAAGVRTLIDGTLGGLSYGRTLGNIAAGFVLFLGIVAALNQVGVATTVTTPVLVAILATIGGILVVGVGGGLIKPMQHRWEGYLSKAEDEAPRIREHARQAPSVREQAQEATQQMSASSTQADYGQPVARAGDNGFAADGSGSDPLSDPYDEPRRY